MIRHRGNTCYWIQICCLWRATESTKPNPKDDRPGSLISHSWRRGRKEATLWRASKGLKLNFLPTYNCDNQTGYQKTYHLETQNSPPTIGMMVTTPHQAWSTAKTDVCAIVSCLRIFYIRIQVPHVASNCLDSPSGSSSSSGSCSFTCFIRLPSLGPVRPRFCLPLSTTNKQQYWG